MLAAFQDMDPNVRLQAVKILENYIKGESAGDVAVLLASDGANLSPKHAHMTTDGMPGKSSSEQILAALMVRERR